MKRVLWWLVLVLAALAACQRRAPSTPTSTPWPTATQQPSPTPSATALTPEQPLLLGLQPEPGATLPVQHARLRLAFSRAMDPASVQDALRLTVDGEPVAVQWRWPEPTLAEVVLPPLPPGGQVQLALRTTARAASGAALSQPVQAAYAVAPPLALARVSPEPDARGVGLRTQLVLTFNQPVVDLAQVGGAEPRPFTVEPDIPGQGRWVDLSTYVFEPADFWAPATTYTFALHPQLRAASGAGLDKPTSWSWRTLPLQVEELNLGPRYAAGPPEAQVPQGARPAGSPLASGRAPNADDQNERVSRSPRITLRLNVALPLDAVQQQLCLSPQAEPQTCLPLQASMPNPDEPVYVFEPRQPLEYGGAYRLVFHREVWAPEAEPVVRVFQVVERPLVPLSLEVPSVGYGDEVYPFPEPNVVGLPTLSAWWPVFVLTFNGPLDPDQDPLAYVRVSPQVRLRAEMDPEAGRLTLELRDFEPHQVYSFTLLPGLRDAWGTPLEGEWQWQVRAPTPPRMLTFGSEYTYGSSWDPAWPPVGVFLLTTGQLSVPVFASQVDEVTIEVRQVVEPGLDAWLAERWREGEDAIRPGPVLFSRQARLGAGYAVVSEEVYWTFPPQPLSPGLYWLRLTETNPPADEAPLTTGWHLVAVVDAHIVLKQGYDEVRAWVVAAADAQPLANAAVQAYADDGSLLFEGQTDEQGLFVWQGEPELAARLQWLVVGQPGQSPFGLVSAEWNRKISPWRFGLRGKYPLGPRLMADLFTDRPLYRPGDVVHLRWVGRWLFDGAYTTPRNTAITCTAGFWDAAQRAWVTVAEAQGRLAEGAYAGDLTLPDDARPGRYRLECTLTPHETGKEVTTHLGFTVAHFRKPTLRVQVDAAAASSGGVEAQVRTSFYSGAVGPHMPFTWQAYARPKPFVLPGYQVGDQWWWEEQGPPFRWEPPWGAVDAWLPVDEGQGRTDVEGRAQVRVTDLPSEATPWEVRLVVSARGPDGVPAAGEARVTVHPVPFYLAVRSQPVWPQAGQEATLEVRALTPDQEPVAGRTVQYRVVRVQLHWAVDPFLGYSLVPTYETVAHGQVVTDAQGVAHIAWTPPEGGRYGVVVQRGRVQTRAELWVGGVVSGGAARPTLPVRLERSHYEPGQTARLFIPNPWPNPARAWVTWERDRVREQRLVAVPPRGTTIAWEVTDAHAPNTFVTVTLVGRDEQGNLSARYGATEYRVTPRAQQLQVRVWAEPATARPGQQVTLHLQVTDAHGNPVQGTFALAVVDQALLDLAGEQVQPIVEVFYAPQGLGVRTALTALRLVWAYRSPPPWVSLGLGGGGGEPEGEAALLPPLRHDFRDTALWLPAVTTDEQGRAQVPLTLPDNLTVWNLWARGLTDAMQVGEARGQLQVTQPLIVEPAYPAFLRAGDRAVLGATVHNQTAQALQAQVGLEAAGLTLEDPAVQTVPLPAQGQARVTWAARAPKRAGQVPLTWWVQTPAGGDRVQPPGTPLSVFMPWAPFATGEQGRLDPNASRQAWVTVPPWARQAELHALVAASPLAALRLPWQMVNRQPYECSEQLASRVWVNAALVAAYEAGAAGSPDLVQDAQQAARTAWAALQQRQLPNGGWPWWPGNDKGDPLVSAYVLWALQQGLDAGVLPKTRETLLARNLGWVWLEAMYPRRAHEWPVQERAFVALVLAELGRPIPPEALRALAQQAAGPADLVFTALALEAAQEPQAAAALWQRLDAYAQVQPDGTVAWAPAGEAVWWRSAVQQAAVVAYGLARSRPEHPHLQPTLRYLLGQRLADGTWGDTFTTAWALSALAAGAQAQGEPSSAPGFRLLWDGALWAEQTLGPPTDGVWQEVQVTGPGVHAWRLENQGPGPLYYNMRVRWALEPDATTPVQRGLSLTRTYAPLDCSAPPCAAFATPRAPAGSVVEVRLTVQVPQAFSYVVVEDPIPAGATALNPLLRSEAAAAGQVPPLVPGSVAWWWGWQAFSQPQIYPDRVVWTARLLEPGVYTLVYYLDLRVPGRYQTPPARVWPFYRPQVQATTGALWWEITPGP